MKVPKIFSISAPSPLGQEAVIAVFGIGNLLGNLLAIEEIGSKPMQEQDPVQEPRTISLQSRPNRIVVAPIEGKNLGYKSEIMVSEYLEACLSVLIVMSDC